METALVTTEKRKIDLKKEKARISKVEKKKKPWPWLMVAARGVVVEVVREVERIGRVAVGKRKKRELLAKIAGMKEKPPEQEDRGTVKRPLAPSTS